MQRFPVTEFNLFMGICHIWLLQIPFDIYSALNETKTCI